MVRLLVTADWQIGLQAAHVASAAAAVREARLKAARNVVEVANRLEVDALVLAGDTFEDNQVSAALAQKVLEILRSSRAPVYVLPGNHDPWGPDSVLKKAWTSLPPHVRVLSTLDPVPIAEGAATLYPCPVSSKTSRRDPTEAIPPRRPEDGIRIGVAHGSLRIEGKYSEDGFPISLDAATRRELDLLVVGHWHSLFFFPSRDSFTVLYPGTHEPTNFGEHDAGHACLVRIDRPRGPIEVREIPTRVLRWVTLRAEVTQTEDVEALERGLRALEDRQHTLVSVDLEGATSLGVLESLRRLQDEVVPALEFLHVRYQGTVRQEPSEAEMEELAATPVLGQVVTRLQNELRQGGPTAEIARQALLLLWSIQGRN
jgi:DNA repair exonuclease SbcCD nuclease subunit